MDSKLFLRFGEGEMVKAEFNISFDLKLSSGSMEGKLEFNLTFEEVEVKVIDEDEDGNRFLEISSITPTLLR